MTVRQRSHDDHHCHEAGIRTPPNRLLNADNEIEEVFLPDSAVASGIQIYDGGTIESHDR